MEDALADEMNMRKKIKQTNDDINQIRFRLHEAEENSVKLRLIQMLMEELLNH